MLSEQKPQRDITTRTFSFSIRIINLVNAIPKTTASHAISNQMIRSETSICANVEEAQDAASRKDFIHCLTISLKEARETYYWLKLLSATNIVDAKRLDGLMDENKELIKILTTIVKNTKKK